MYFFRNHLINLFCLIITISIYTNVYSQSPEDWQCGVSLDTSLQNLIEAIDPVIDDTFKVGLLLVQFSDWQSNPDARGGVGWSTSDTLTAVIDTMKYKYNDYWNIFFSFKTYIDDNPNDPQLHPDAHSHNIAVWGSFTDYWWEVSHKNLLTEAAETHPGHAWGVMYQTGLINQVNTVDSTVEWLTLDLPKSQYGSPSSVASAARSKAHQMYQAGLLDVDIENTAIFDKVIIQFAGLNIFGYATIQGTRYTISSERNKYYPTAHLTGFGIDAHEFGHLLGFRDLYGDANRQGVGYFSLMANGILFSRGKFLPAHVDPWHKLQIGWLDFDIIDNDTSNLTLYAVEDTLPSNLPEVSILKVNGNPATSNWVGGGLEYFVLENRSIMGFDRLLKWRFENLDFDGGLVIWHYAGGQSFPNGRFLQVVEADANTDFPYGHMAAPPSQGGILAYGAPYDFYPGVPPNLVTTINDTTLPNLHLKGDDYSHLALEGIRFYSSNYSVNIDTIETQKFLLVISHNTTWSGTVYLDRDVLINNNATLTIQPGTVILIDTISAIERVAIRVNDGCCLNAFGTNSNPIEFKSALSNPTFSDWEGILFANGSQGELNHCIFNNASNAITGYLMETGNLEISNSKFDETIINSENVDSTIFIKDSDFINNCLLQAYSSCITVENNNFLDGSHIFLFDDNSVIKNNIMIENTGIYNGITIDLTPLSTTQIYNNTFALYNHAIYLAHYLNHNLIIRNNIFYLNNSSATLAGSITYNDFWNKDSATFQLPDTTNMKADPKFVDPLSGDFHLKSISLCIDRGDPNDDYSLEPYPNGNRINMGAYGNTPEATLSFDLIVQNDLTSNTTWGGYVNILNDISSNGYSLTVQPGTKVLFDNNKSLSINGIFISDGQPNPSEEPDPIIFEGYRTNDVMGGVYIHSDAASEIKLHYTHFKQGDVGLHLDEIPYNEENVFDHLLFEDNTTGLYVSKSSIEITSSNFQNCESGLISQSSSLNLSDSYFVDNSKQGLYLFESDFMISSNSFLNNGLRGVYFQYSSDGTFWDNTISFNGSSIIDTYIRGGLVFYQSSPYLNENYITENYASGILSMSSSFPVLIEEGLNLISENRKSEQENDPEILVKDISFPVIDYGHNDIMDNLGGYFIYGDEDLREMLVYIRRNYWGTLDEEEIESRLYRMGGFIFQPFDEEPNTGGSSAAAGSEELFASAISAEKDSNYTLALSKYDSVITISPGTNFAKGSMIQIFTLQRKTGVSLSDIQSYFNNLMNHPDEGISHIARRLSIQCLTLNEQYQSAIDQHLNWQKTTGYLCDSVYSAMDIETNNLYLQGGRLNKAFGIYPREKIIERENFKAYQNKSEKLLNILFNNTFLRKSAGLPTTFAISQNYPNPFNPTTTIEFQLPYDSKVLIQIFNILGQKIRTLVEEKYSAGHYKIHWDGKNQFGNQTASGIYIYQIKAETNEIGFVKSKKMILIK